MTRYITSGYAPISIRLVEMILKEGKIGAGEIYCYFIDSVDITRLINSDYDHTIIKSPNKHDSSKPVRFFSFLIKSSLLLYISLVELHIPSLQHSAF